MDKIHIPEHHFLGVIWVWLTFVLNTFPICLMWWHLKLNSQQRLKLNPHLTWKKRSLCQRNWFNYWPISLQVIDKCIITQFLRNRRNLLSSKPQTHPLFLWSCVYTDITDNVILYIEIKTAKFTTYFQQSLIYFWKN